MTSCLAFALDTVPRRSPHEVDLTHNMPTDGGAARRSVESNASNDGTLSTDSTAATTNTISSNRSSARIVSLESGHLSKMSVISLQAIVNGKRALKPVPHRKATLTPADTGSIDWCSPFASNNSVSSSNDPQAYEPDTEWPAKSSPIIPRITIKGCDEKTFETTAEMREGSSCSDTDGSRLSCNSDRSGDRPGSTTSTKSQVNRPHSRHSNASPTGQVYVPYRPWYLTPKSPGSVANRHQNVRNEDDTFALRELDKEQSKAKMAEITSLDTSTDLLLAELQPLVRCNGINHEPRTIFSEQAETAHVVPIMPARPPPRPPITRNKRKPPVPPPRRRLLRDLSPSLSAQQGFSPMPTLSSVSTQAITSAGLQKRSRAVMEYEPTLLVSLQDVLDRSLAIRQRASTGDLVTQKEHTHSATARLCRSSPAESHRDDLPRSLRRLSPNIDMRLSRPASTPELNPFKSEPTNPPGVSELEVREQSLLTENQATIRFDDEPCDIKEVLQDMRAVENKRIRDICESWNNKQWAKVEVYLTYHLSTLKASANSERARRIRHLLGVCASYRGHWQRSLSLFISVLRTPVEDIKKLDDGDLAAFYWLADTYALLGSPREALLAYCLGGCCGHGQSASGSGSKGSSWRCLVVERKLLRQTVSDTAFEAIWANDFFRTGTAVDGQLLHSTIVSQAAAQACLQECAARAEEEACEVHARDHHSASQNRPDKPEPYQMHISPLHFEPDQLWPMPHDTTFSTSSVTRGRIFTHGTDLILAFQQHPETFLPRQSHSFPTIARTVTGEGLTQLIRALRETLQTLSMSWTEVLAPRDVSFMVAYTAIEDGIATVKYFKLDIVKLPFGIEYGVVLCSGRTSSSARITTSEISKIGRRLAAATTRRAVRNCLRTTLEAVVCERRRRAASKFSRVLPALPPLVDVPVQPLPLPVVPAPAPAPTPTPPSPSPSPSPSPPPSSNDQTTTTETEMSASLHELESSSPRTRRSVSTSDDSPLVPREAVPALQLPPSSSRKPKHLLSA
jgi:hypothetical protein